MVAIRDATRAELAESGYAGVTFEGIARRVRTSKPVLYRRYRSRAHMVVDALPGLGWSSEDIPATQSLRDDLLALFGAVLDNFHVIGIETYRSLIADADEELLNILEAQIAGLADRTIHRALKRARERGEIGLRDIPPRAATVIGVLVRNELFFTHNAVDRDTLADMLDTVYLPLIGAISR
jgi:AcrR family transcriptional regulator